MDSDFKVHEPKCPTCGGLAVRVLELVYCEAHITTKKDGTANYAGESEIFWDSQTTIMKGGKLDLRCAEGHSWLSTCEHCPSTVRDPEEAMEAHP